MIYKKLLIIIPGIIIIISPIISFASDSKVKIFSDINKIEQDKPVYAEGEVLIKFKNDVVNLSLDEDKASAFATNKNLDIKENITSENISLYKTKNNESVEVAVARLKTDSSVEYAQPNFQYYTTAIGTNDTDRNKLWGLDNTGQSVNGVAGKNDADIDAPEAWAINEGTNGTVVVAVIDTGVAYNHPDLKANMWNGTNCKSYTGSALGNCLYGYDFVGGDKNPLTDGDSHGTHVSGTIAAVKNNSKGIIGVAPRAKIMAIKAGDQNGVFTTANIIKSINFAKYNGANVINASFGGSSSTCAGALDTAYYTAIKNFSGLFIAAAGNAAANHNGTSYFSLPSDYGHTTSCWTGLENIISVAATDQNDTLASFSDFGKFVDVAAPGVNIYSTVTDTISLYQTFEDITPPSIPIGWVKTGNWGTYATGNTARGNVLYGDLAYPYSNNADTSVTSSAINMSTAIAATFNFWTSCDTEPWSSLWYDYMSLDVSADGASFTQLFRWHEGYINDLNDDYDSSGSGVYYFSGIDIPAQYLTSNFKFRLRWITDSFLNNYYGCMIDDVTIIKSTDGSDQRYEYMDGTSMAAPHVAGLAALIMGYNPDLDMQDVKEIILESGDELSSLKGKTVTGRRINAQKALIQANQAPSLGILVSQSSDAKPYIKRLGHHGAVVKSFRVYDKEGGISSIDADINGDGINEIIVAPNAGLGGKIKAYRKDGTVLATYSPFGTTFNKGISLTAGDVNNDGKDEIIVAPMTKGTPKIKVLKYASKKITLLRETSVFGSSVPGGLNISCGDVNGDGIDEIVVSPYQDSTVSDQVVKIYAYRNGNLVKLASKKLFASGFKGIKTITADMNGDYKDEIIATPSLDAGDYLNVYSYASGSITKINTVTVYSDAYNGMTSLSKGDINNDNKDEVVLSVRTGGKPYIFIYKLSANKLKLHDKILVYDKTFTGGVNAIMLDVDSDSKAEVITAPYSGKQKIKVYDVESTTEKLHSSFWGFGKDFEGGVSFAQ